MVIVTGEYTQMVKNQFSVKFPDTPVPNRHNVGVLIKIFRETR